MVVSDRYDLSTMAYQAAGRGLPEQTVREVNQLATSGLVPDLTLIVDVPAAEGRRRQQAIGKVGDRFEREDPAFHERVLQRYRAERGPSVVHLNGTESPGAVVDAAWAALVASRPDTFRGPVA